MAERSFPSPGVWSSSLPSRMYRRESSGRLRAICATRVPTAAASAASDFMNFSRAGVLKKSSRTAMVVPSGHPAASTSPGTPPSRWRLAPASAPRCRETTSRRLTAAMAARASPRKPRVPMAARSWAVRSLLVACRRKAVGSSSGAMPQPSSVIRIRAMPPERISTVTAAAPASMAFSMSSLTTLAGRSTTSPAAIRSATWGESCWIWGISVTSFCALM